MNPETRDKLRAAGHRQGNCPRCGNAHVRAITDAEKLRRDDLFVELNYRECPGCGHVWRVRSKAPKG